ncbi:MAG TPA: YbhB/YbcL family Raf kinase inhibitor-like protein [Polyangiaceae bacterium]|nr:YbhB/YbcL family Raf kinase inhibitor-like protein [Polyangiaceae bacterium]
MRVLSMIGVAAALLVSACDSNKSAPISNAHSETSPAKAQQAQPKEQGMTAFKLESSAFTAGGSIPKDHTCEGKNSSPPLSWSAAPMGTKSFALIIDDPDAPDPAAPKRVWVHWVIYNIAAAVTSLPQGVSPAGALDGVNDWNKPGYAGPCPPIGKHRYFHRLYALDTVLPDLKGPSKVALLQAMQGHILAQAELMGSYQKSGQ